MWNTEKKFDFMSRNRGGRGGGKEERKKEGYCFLGFQHSNISNPLFPLSLKRSFWKLWTGSASLHLPFLCVCVCVWLFLKTFGGPRRNDDADDNFLIWMLQFVFSKFRVVYHFHSRRLFFIENSNWRLDVMRGRWWRWDLLIQVKWEWEWHLFVSSTLLFQASIYCPRKVFTTNDQRYLDISWF